MARSSRVFLPVVLVSVAVLALFQMGSAFLPAPGVVTEAPQLRFLQAAAVSTGAAVLSSGLPALAAMEVEPDSAEAYNQKVLNAAAWCLTLAVFLVGLIISQARKLVENKWLN
ncbi:unnamed protein product [Polarella glacialis]|uniref:Uncharacterized protein n=1 Tax=Polarella glacialis TaxID=89957 RepID=A0A813IRJ3_POLGL|nr:unnamed protein product [Polarella glacialis]CAE8635279.1 unnamed protein product [Polarella glacialis]CAE8653725.1 unnamed protein product [Polarella glacialis]CAE8653726.1 unnamed protein product [Polarella glacialis]